MKTSKWIHPARIAIFIFLIVLFFNAYSLFTEIRRDIMYHSRTYGLEVLNDYFDEGKEWWGYGLWSIHDKLTGRFAVIGASATN